MGNFSWCTSDTRKSVACVYDSYEGAPQTVYLLNPFGEPYVESAYDGYGEFGGHDVYDLVVDWNRKYLSADNLRKPVRDDWAPGEEGDRSFSKTMELYTKKCRGIEELAAGASDEYMKEHYGTVFGYGDGSDWKRCLGIDIACYDEEHVKLKYPIKIVENPVPYEQAGISPHCPFQGCFYDEDVSKVRQQKIDRVFDRLDAAKDAYFEQLKDLSFVIKKCEDMNKKQDSHKTEPKLVQMPGTESPDWGKKHWGNER